MVAAAEFFFDRQCAREMPFGAVVVALVQAKRAQPEVPPSGLRAIAAVRSLGARKSALTKRGRFVQTTGFLKRQEACTQGAFGLGVFSCCDARAEGFGRGGNAVRHGDKR